MKAHCTLTGSFPEETSMSPRPTSLSAPVASRIVLESIDEKTRKAILRREISLNKTCNNIGRRSLGRYDKVYPYRSCQLCKPPIGPSISLPAVIIRSANSSIINTIYGRYLCPFSGLSFREINLSLYSLMFRD